MGPSGITAGTCDDMSLGPRTCYHLGAFSNCTSSIDLTGFFSVLLFVEGKSSGYLKDHPRTDVSG